MKRGICAALVFCLLLSVCIPCFAEETQPAVSPRYAYIDACNYSLSISSAGVATCKKILPSAAERWLPITIPMTEIII